MRQRPGLLTLFLLAALAPWPVLRADAAEPAKRFRALGHKIEVKLDRKATNGAYSVLEMTDAPGNGPPRHVHSAEDEIFHVLQGRVRFWRGSETFVAGPGAVVYMPRNVPHTFKNVGKTESRVLILITPGRLQGFFEEAAARNIVMPRDAAAFAGLAERYGIKVLGPAPGGEAANAR
jgi:quercetin dioxygenase-like cupin family protein